MEELLLLTELLRRLTIYKGQPQIKSYTWENGPKVVRLFDSSFNYAVKCTVQGQNAGGGEIFRTRPDRPWGTRSLLYNGYRVTLEGKADGSGVNTPPPSSAEVKERVELYLCSPSGLSLPVIG